MKRQILIIIPSLRGGGAERTLINLLQNVDYKRYSIDLLCVSKTGPYLDSIPKEVTVKYLYKSHLFVRFLAYLQRKFRFRYFFKKNAESIKKEYDVGISFLDSGFTDILMFTTDVDRKYAFVHSSYKSHYNKYKFYKRPKLQEYLKRERYSKLDGIIFVSDDARKEFEQLFGRFEDTTVIYNMIDKERVKRKANSDIIPVETVDYFNFVAVGSLIPVKGFDRLIRSAAILKEKGYLFKINMAGEGPERKHLEKLIDKLDLKSEVILHGFLDNPYPLMKSADVFVMSSLSEALPTVLCEAMILGKPVLVTNCSGCRGLVEGGEYGLVSEQDDLDLANKMIQYIENPSLVEHFGEKSKYRSKLFDDDKVLQQYYSIFDDKIFK